MKRLVLAVGVIALGVAALTPARADFAVIRFKDHHCQAWADSRVGALVPRRQVSGGRPEELGRCHDARQVGDEAPPLQELVLM
jgi:hypothetical protein